MWKRIFDKVLRAKNFKPKLRSNLLIPLTFVCTLNTLNLMSKVPEQLLPEQNLSAMVVVVGRIMSLTKMCMSQNQGLLPYAAERTLQV